MEASVEIYYEQYGWNFNKLEAIFRCNVMLRLSNRICRGIVMGCTAFINPNDDESYNVLDLKLSSDLKELSSDLTEDHIIKIKNLIKKELIRDFKKVFLNQTSEGIYE